MQTLNCNNSSKLPFISVRFVVNGAYPEKTHYRYNWVQNNCMYRWQNKVYGDYPDRNKVSFSAI